jgi:hypothetical protein
MVETPASIARLAAGGEALRAAVLATAPEQAHWRPAAGKWSVLEVVCHLVDEEREDFRLRLDLLLHHPDQVWPASFPEKWPAERKYDERELGPTLAAFLGERAQSLAWLQGLKTVDWSRAYQHRRQPPLTAGDLLTSWVAHDLLHLRQLTRLHYEYLTHVALPHSPGYAGTW